MTFYEEMLKFMPESELYDVLLQAGFDSEEITKCQQGYTIWPKPAMMCAVAELTGIGIHDIYPHAEIPYRAYLAGRITGNTDFLKEFEENQKMLEGLGFDVVNPAAVTNVLPKNNMQRSMFMDLSICLIHMCDFIVLQPNWNQSKGCQMERSIAESYGMPVFFSQDISRWLKSQNPKDVKEAIRGIVKESRKN